MARKIIKLPSMSRVVPGSKAVLELPIGPTYRRVYFVATAAAGLDIADFGRMDVLIDGKVVHAGGVPSRDKVAGWLAGAPSAPQAAPAGNCCSGGKCC